MELGKLTPEEQRAATDAEYLRSKLPQIIERNAAKFRRDVTTIVDGRLSELGFDGASQHRRRAGNSLRVQGYPLLLQGLSYLIKPVLVLLDRQEQKLRETALNSRLPNSSLSDGVTNSPSSSEAKAGGASSSAREGGAA